MIMVVVGRLSKMRHYISCTAKETENGTSAPAMARLFLDHVFQLHGLPETIVSDRGPQFSSAFWEHLTTSLGIKRKPSTAYHPQTDGLTERANQDLKNYLGRSVSWKQDDWARWLSVAEFAAHTAPSAMTGISPFHALYGYKPRMDVDIPTGEPGTLTHNSGKLHAQRQAEALATSLKQSWVDLREAIQTSQPRVSSRENEKRRDPTLTAGDLAYLDTRHLSSGRRTPKLDYRWVSSRENEKRRDPTLAAGDLAYLDTRHLSSGRRTPKLDYRWTGPYRVEAVYGGSAKLSLPTGSKIHPTVNLSYLRQFDNDPLPGQTSDAESPDPVIPGEDPSEDDFEVTHILDSRINRQYRGGRLQFRVAWPGWRDDPSWYNADDGEFSHTKDAFSEFHPLPSTKVRRPSSAEVTPPSSPTGKPRDKSFFPRGGWCYGPQALYTFPTSTYHTSLNPLPYFPLLVHVPLFKLPRLILIT